MEYNQEVTHRKSIRLQGYDYAQQGVYFVTICTENREYIFGQILDDGKGTKYCASTDIGRIAKQCWHEIPKHYPFVELDAFVLMPNHVHGIIRITNDIPSVRANDYSPDNRTGKSMEHRKPLVQLSVDIKLALPNGVR